jgi:hypothetical protein
MVNVKKLTLKTLRANHPEASAVLRCTYRYFGTRYYLLIGEEKVDCTEELLSIAKEAALIRLTEIVDQF